jgi:predicted O-methyltransferase YrrM
MEKVLKLIEQLRFTGVGEAYSERGKRNPIRDDTGPALSAITAMAPRGALLELGTAYGLSMAWFYLGDPNREYFTCEFDAATAAKAQANFDSADMNVRVFSGDAGVVINEWSEPRIAVLFLDHEKRLYVPHFEAIRPFLIDGAVVVADNVIDRAEECQPFVDLMHQVAKQVTLVYTECGLLVAKF